MPRTGSTASGNGKAPHTCHDMNPPFPYECAACIEERINAALQNGRVYLPAEWGGPSVAECVARIEELEARLKMEVEAHFRAATALHYAEDERDQLRLLVYEPEPTQAARDNSGPTWEPASWIDRWREEHEARLSALQTIRVIEETNRIAFGFIRTFHEKLGEHARVGVLGQLWLEARRLLGTPVSQTMGHSSPLAAVDPVGGRGTEDSTRVKDSDPIVSLSRLPTEGR